MLMKSLLIAAHVVTRHYSTPQTDHAFMEPECAIAVKTEDGIQLYTGGQSIYDEQHEVISYVRFRRISS